MKKSAKSNKNSTLTGAFDLFSKSSSLVRANLMTFAALYFIPFMTTVGSRRQQSNLLKDGHFTNISNALGLPGYASSTLLGFGIVVFLAVFFVSLLVTVMTYSLELESSKGKKPQLIDLWADGKKYWLRMFGLLLSIGVLLILGLLLFIVPGLIVIRRYFLAPFLMIDKDLSISQAMKQSANLTKNHAGDIWNIIGVMILLSLTGIVPVFGWVISFILSMLYSVAPALRYQELKKLA